MIRQANKYDTTEIIQTMLEFCKESKIKHLQNLNNTQYWEDLLNQIYAGRGVVFIEQNKGLIMAIISPSIWCNKTYVLHELAWYVKPEYRHTTVGYRLLKAYIDYAEELKKQNRIHAFTMTKMVTSPDIKYEKFGFSKLEENWIQ